MRKMAILTAAAVMASAGAAQAFFGDRVVSDFIDDQYDPSQVRIFAAAGAPTAIYGATRDGASAEAMAAGFRLPGYLSQRNVTAGPVGERDEPHLVLVFAPNKGTSARQACRGEASGGTAGAELKVLGVFCNGYDRPVAEGVLLSSASPTPGGGDYASAMKGLMNAILPPRNPHHENEIIRRD